MCICHCSQKMAQLIQAETCYCVEKKVIVFLCRLTDKCDFCQGTLYINHIVVSLLRWVSGGT